MLKVIRENVELISSIVSMIILILASMTFAYGICISWCFDYGTGGYKTTISFVMFGVLVVVASAMGAMGAATKKPILNLIFIIYVPMLLVFSILILFLLIGTRSLRHHMLKPYNVFLLHTVEHNYQCCGYNGIHDYKDERELMFSNHCCNLRDISTEENLKVCQKFAAERPNCKDVVLDGLFKFTNAMVFFHSCTITLLILSWLLAIIKLHKIRHEARPQDSM